LRGTRRPIGCGEQKLIKNVTLALVSTGLLTLLFGAYFMFIDEPREDDGGGGSTKQTPLPPDMQHDGGGEMALADFAQVPPGGEIQFRVYEPKTGKATQFA